MSVQYSSKEVSASFHPDRWKEYSLDQRKKVLQDFENAVADEECRKPRKVVTKDLGDGTAGVFNEKDDKIYINKRLVENDSMNYQVMSTTLHEGRHAYQRDVIGKKVIIDKDMVNEAIKWKINNETYYSPGDHPSSMDMTTYRNQSVECDANDFADFRMKQMFDSIGKEGADEFLKARECRKRGDCQDWYQYHHEGQPYSKENYFKMCDEIDQKHANEYYAKNKKIPTEMDFKVENNENKNKNGVRR